jgi:hypothetical protein
LENDRDKMMWFKMNITGSEGERGEGGKMMKNGGRAIVELIMKSEFGLVDR